jgi:hypothetical protein
MSVPVTLENCKYVYIGGREVVELPRSFPSKNPPDVAHSPILLVVAEQNCPDSAHKPKL